MTTTRRRKLSGHRKLSGGAAVLLALGLGAAPAFAHAAPARGASSPAGTSGPAVPAPTSTADVSNAATSTTATTTTQLSAAATCTGAKRPGRVITVRGMPRATTATARALLVGGVRCDAAALTKRAERDTTRLTFGIVTAKEFFALPEKETKYRYLVDALVKARPGYDKISRTYVWPRLAAGDGYKDRSAWDEAVAAGLLTKAQAQQMRRDDTGYLGWRIGVSDRGEWHFFIAGD